MTWHESYLVLFSFLGILGTFIAIFVARHYQKKEFDRGGMLQVFESLSNEDNKKIRRNVYEAFCTGKISNDGKILDDNYKLDIEEARTIFGRLGRMVKDGNIPKKHFLATYSGVIIRVWKSLEKNIEREREIRDMKEYMNAFEELYKSALEFWEKNYTDTEPDPCGKKTNEVIKNKKST